MDWFYYYYYPYYYDYSQYYYDSYYYPYDYNYYNSYYIDSYDSTYQYDYDYNYDNFLSSLFNYDSLLSFLWFPISGGYSIEYPMGYSIFDVFTEGTGKNEYSQEETYQYEETQPYTEETYYSTENYYRPTKEEVYRNLFYYLPDWVYYQLPSLERIAKYQDYIYEASQMFDVPPEYIIATIIQESRGNPRAVSRAGAIGLMQVLPSTAYYMSKVGYCPFKFRSKYDARRKLFDPRINIICGTAYIRYLIDNYIGYFDPELIAVGYNAGPRRIYTYMKGGRIPRETQKYVQKVAREYYPILTSAVNQVLGI